MLTATGHDLAIISRGVKRVLLLRIMLWVRERLEPTYVTDPHMRPRRPRPKPYITTGQLTRACCRELGVTWSAVTASKVLTITKSEGHVIKKHKVYARIRKDAP